jgi:integrase
MTLHTLFNDFYRPLKLRGRSANTSRLYGCTIRSFSRWLKHDATTDDLSDLTLSQFLEHRGQARSPYTAEKERSQLCALWRFAADRRIVGEMPCVPPAPLPERIPHAWSVEQMQALMQAARKSRGYVGEVQACVWFPALITVLWETAERIGAIMACTPADLSPPVLTVLAEYRKGGRRDRTYRLSHEACALAAQACGKDRIFEWPQARTYLWERYRDIVSAAGLGTGRKCGFHQLRRTAASHFAALGGDPVKLLDHSSPRITQRWYLDRRMTDKDPPACDVLPKIE